MLNLPQGLGESLGDSMVTQSPVVTNGDIFYVHHTGSDSYDGRDRVRPKATLAAAVTALSGFTGGVVVCLDGHTETISTKLTLDDNVQGIAIVGAGNDGGQPTVKFTPGAALSTVMWDVQTWGVTIRNVTFLPHAAALAQYTVDVSGTGIIGNTGFLMRGCRFEVNENDTKAGLGIAKLSRDGRIENTTFVSTASGPASQPLTAVETYLNGELDVGTVWFLEDVVFDAGLSGFGEFHALNNNSSPFQLFRFERLSLLRGADLLLSEDSIGWVNVGTAQSGARVDW